MKEISFNKTLFFYSLFAFVVVLQTSNEILNAQETSDALSSWKLKFADNPELPPSFKQTEALRQDESKLTIFLGNSEGSLDGRKPLLIYVEGSGAQSHFIKLDEKRIAAGIIGLLANRYGKSHHVVCSEKRGVPFGFSAQRGTGEGGSIEYNKHATLESRVADVRLLLDTLLAEDNVDKTQVILLGHSEGADVVARVAAVDTRVTHVAFLSGGGTAQFFDFYVQQRKSLAEKGATAEEVEAAISELERQIKDILANPESEEKFFAGHAYKRWSSFATVAAAENLVKTKAHLFLAHGSADQAVPIESFDYLVVELLRHGRTDVTVRRYPDRDHSFIKVGDDPSNDPFLEVVDEVVAWAGKAD